MKISDPFALVHYLNEIQRRAGVAREVRELVCAFARQKADAGLYLAPLDGDQHGLDPADLSVFTPKSAGMNSADPRFLAFIEAYSRMMSGKRRPVILSTSHLARKLGLTYRQLLWLSWKQAECYRRFSIPKPSGGARIIDSPDGKLRSAQAWIKRRILDQAASHRCAMAFRRGISILDNAARHQGRKVVVRIDLKDFFPSVTVRQVRRVFEQLGYPYGVACMLANLCTLEGRLPQGAATSPALANLVCRRMDERFYRLSRKLKCRYTRYADDLVFSSRDSRLPSLIPFFKQVAREEGFEVNEDKVRIMRSGQRQVVTGLVVNQRPALARPRMRRLRAMAHRFATQGPDAVQLPASARPDADPRNVLAGHLAFARMVQPERGVRLAALMANDRGVPA